MANSSNVLTGYLKVPPDSKLHLMLRVLDHHAIALETMEGYPECLNEFKAKVSDLSHRQSRFEEEF